MEAQNLEHLIGGLQKKQRPEVQIEELKQNPKKELTKQSKLQQVAEKDKVTVVAMSANVNSQIIEKCFNLGITQVINKPVSDKDLKKMIYLYH